jgi:type IV pilus assembly protein PilY1
MKKWFIIIMVLVASFPALLQADDTEIYGTVTNTSLEPNVLIIFDSSGSMSTQDVPGEAYDPMAIYSGSYSKDAVYVRQRIDRQYVWIEFAPNIYDLNCTPVRDLLLVQGYASGRISGERFNYACSDRGQSLTLRMGNYMNYNESGVGASRRRIDVAKDVIRDLIDRTTGVRFGAMRFNYQDGGRLIAACGTATATLKSQIDSITADGWTPLAETLAEAGLYFAGLDSWFNAGVTYTSPMEERCQKNYIIIMTDGEPTQDIDAKLTTTNYINGDIIGDYDNDGNDPGTYDSNGSDYLDDVAKYLYERDCNPTLGDGTSFDKQNIVTYTIGFQVNQELLQETAANGGGEYYTATNYSELSEAFYHIISSISEENAVFVAPVVPISRMNRTYAGDRIYLGFFKPQISGRWIGNIKRYGLDNDGILYDANNVEATTPEGLIKNNALSYWTTLGNDGPDVSAGGAAEVLQLLIDGSGSRNIYTYTDTYNGSEPVLALTDPANAFVDTNTAITNTLLGVAGDTDRINLIESVRTSFFGDIIHSEPVVVYYPDPDGNPATDDDKTMIYAGANDGMLHCLDDDNGNEAWSFIPPSQLERLTRLTDDDHDYFVDGSPVVYINDSQMIMIFGERRGGHDYSALDITSPSAPVWLYSIGPHILDPDLTNDPDTDTYEILGQSWGKPERATIATGAVATISDCDLSIETTAQDVFLIPGGYDNNQDLNTPSATDTVGKAVFAVDVASGALVNAFNFNAVSHPSLGMTHSIVDLTALDPDGDGIDSRIYAGDLGGNVFAFKDDELMTFTDTETEPECSVSQTVVDGSWSAKKLFNASADGVQRKIFYAPDAVAEELGEMIFFGTGDRADPGETTVVNRIYAIKNDWSSSATLTESDLVDVTDDLIQLGNETQKAGVQTALDNAQGWYFRLENPGEKVVAAPRVYGGVVYFTTYTPSDDTGTVVGDPCAVSTVRGVGRLYAVDYKTGGSVLELSSEVETDTDGGVVAMGKKDRSVAIGTAIPSAPVIAILAGGARIFIGVEGGIASLPTVATQDMHTYFWTQIF